MTVWCDLVAAKRKKALHKPWVQYFRAGIGRMDEGISRLVEEPSQSPEPPQPSAYLLPHHVIGGCHCHRLDGARRIAADNRFGGPPSNQHDGCQIQEQFGRSFVTFGTLPRLLITPMITMGRGEYTPTSSVWDAETENDAPKFTRQRCEGTKLHHQMKRSGGWNSLCLGRPFHCHFKAQLEATQTPHCSPCLDSRIKTLDAIAPHIISCTSPH